MMERPLSSESPQATRSHTALLTEGAMELDALSQVNDGAFVPLVSSAGLGWKGFRMERHQIQGSATTPTIVFPAHIIGLLLRGGYKKDVPGRAARRTIAHHAGNVLLYPAELPHVGHSFNEADFLVLYFEPWFVEDAAREVVQGRIEMVPHVQFEDALVADVARHLLGEVESGGATGILYAQSLMTALCAKLAHNYANSRPLSPPSSGALAPRALRRVTEYVDDHLACELSLEELAGVLNMSAFYFARMFKNSIGKPPHAFLIERRVERAKELLRRWPDMTLAQVAREVGFAHDSHLIRHFKRQVGVTPREFRQK